MKMKTKIRSHKYDINRPRSRHGHKHSNNKKCLYDDACMYETAPKQHLKLNSSRSLATLTLC